MDFECTKKSSYYYVLDQYLKNILTSIVLLTYRKTTNSNIEKQPSQSLVPRASLFFYYSWNNMLHKILSNTFLILNSKVRTNRKKLPIEITSYMKGLKNYFEHLSCT